MSALFRIKICGVTTIEDARMVEASGADAIGFNFSDQSSRRVDLAAARPISESVAGRLLRVGVFVNQSVDEVNRISSEVQLDVVQLHGDESVEYLTKMSLPTIKALPFGDDGIRPLLDFWKAAAGKLAIAPDTASSKEATGGLIGLLIDASVAGRYGGTGSTVDWDRLAKHERDLSGIPWALAGGLNSDNVGDAIKQLAPHGVDVASGVESAPGKKDSDQTAKFVTMAQQAWRQVARQ